MCVMASTKRALKSLSAPLAVVPEDFARLLYVAVPVALLHAWWWRGFVAASFDPEGARVRGLPVAVIEVALFLTLAILISVCTRILGALPTFAFSVLPGLAAVAIAPSVGTALVAAVLLGAASGFAGYVAAYLYELPVPAGQTLTATVLLLVALAVGRLARRA